MRHVVLALTLALAACSWFGGKSGGSGGSGGGGSGGGGSSVADANQLHNLDALNMYRAQNGVGALAIDDQLSMFSTTASEQLEATGQAHGYFVQQANSGAIWQQGFCSNAGENQAPGWDTNGDIDGTVDAILKAMMDEGPGGGHHDNIVNASFTRVGVGLVLDSQQRLWFTNDFSGPCH
jgi:uncharacterized protein YkwD